MDFGALSPDQPFDLNLAPLHPGSEVLLSRFKAASAQLRFEPEKSLHIGAPQWTIPGLCKTVNDYALHWDSIEFNASFYQVPGLVQVKTWADKTPDEFRFFIKLHQGLSHDLESLPNPELRRLRMREFVTAWKELGHKWGGSFLQLSPQFTFHSIGLLEAWILDWQEIAPGVPLHIELRHPSWFENRQLKREAARLFAIMKVGAVCTDTPGRREVSHGTLTTDTVLIRFLGQSTETHPSPLPQDLERLEAWADRVTHWRTSGLKGIAFFIHTPDQVWVSELSKRFRRSLLIEDPTPQKGLFS